MQKIELCFWWEHWNKKNKNKLVLVKSITCTAVLVVSYSHCPLCLFDLNSGLPGNQFCNFGYIYLFDSSDIRVPLMWTQEDHNKTKAGTYMFTPFPLKFHANPVCVDICYYNYNYFDYYYFYYYSQIVSTVFLVWLRFQFVTFYPFRYFYIHIILDWVALSPTDKKKFSWALKKTFFTMREIKIFKSEGSWNCSTSLSKGKEKKLL